MRLTGSTAAPKGEAGTGPGRGSVQTRKRQLVREEIVRSAVTLFAERGARGVTLEEVARGLGYTKSSVYYYFRSKEDLLWAVFDFISSHFVREAAAIAERFPDPMQRLEELIRMHVRFLAKHKEWTTVFYREVSALSPERQAEVRDVIVKYDGVFREAVQDGIAAGVMKPMAADIAVNAVLGACNWMGNWISSRHQEQIDEIADTYLTIFTQGVAAAGAA